MSDEIDKMLQEEVKKGAYAGNKQAFVNNPSTGLQPGEEMAFHLGKKNPNLTIINERPEHLMIVLMKLRSFTNREIAERTQLTEAWVSQITRQPWFKDRVFQFLKEQGGDIINERLKLEVLPSIEKLVDIRDDVSAGARAQASAACYLLDRFLGKATQRTEIYNAGKAPSLESMEQLDAELAKAELELQRLAPKQPDPSPAPKGLN